MISDNIKNYKNRKKNCKIKKKYLLFFTRERFGVHPSVTRPVAATTVPVREHAQTEHEHRRRQHQSQYQSSDRRLPWVPRHHQVRPRHTIVTRKCLWSPRSRIVNCKYRAIHPRRIPATFRVYQKLQISLIPFSRHWCIFYKRSSS